MAGFRNAVVFGRAVTNVVEHLRGKVEDFDKWYKPRSTGLGQDEGFATLYKLRSQILKEGTGDPGVSVHIKSLDSGGIALLMRNPPTGALGFFIGDSTGGSGWEVAVGDGETEKFYVTLPSSIDVSVAYQVGDENAGELLTRYLDAMGSLIAEAGAKWGEKG